MKNRLRYYATIIFHLHNTHTHRHRRLVVRSHSTRGIVVQWETLKGTTKGFLGLFFMTYKILTDHTHDLITVLFVLRNYALLLLIVGCIMYIVLLSLLTGLNFLLYIGTDIIIVIFGRKNVTGDQTYFRMSIKLSIINSK